MVNVDVVISSLIAQAPLVAIVVVVLYYSLDKKIDSVRGLVVRIDKLERRIDGLEARVGELASGFVEFREAF